MAIIVPNEIVWICICYTWNDFKEERINLEQKLIQRPSAEQLVEMGILPPDSDIIQELRLLAQRHRRIQTPPDLSSTLPFDDETNEQVAHRMMGYINNCMEDDI